MFGTRQGMLGIRHDMLRLSSRSFTSSSIRLIKHKVNYKSADSTVDSDEIISENNPWSPTLLNDIVRIRKTAWVPISTALPAKYRLSYNPLYESPGAKYIGLLKRLTLSFSVIGLYGAKLFYESPQFDDIYALITLISCSTPAVVIQLKTKDYVTRIFRLYDKELPQTLENLVSNEQLIMEKLNFSGSKTYNQLLQISGNTELKLLQKEAILGSKSTWQDKDRVFNVVDNIGGLKMDRLWGIVEKNSGVDSGR